MIFCAIAVVCFLGGAWIMNYPVVNLNGTGANIRKLRKERNIKIGVLADYLGFSDVQAIYKWERGICLPTLENCFALSKYLNVCVEDILICEGEISSSVYFMMLRRTDFLVAVILHVKE